MKRDFGLEIPRIFSGRDVLSIEDCAIAAAWAKRNGGELKTMRLLDPNSEDVLYARGEWSGDQDDHYGYMQDREHRTYTVKVWSCAETEQARAEQTMIGKLCTSIYNDRTGANYQRNYDRLLSAGYSAEALNTLAYPGAEAVRAYHAEWEAQMETMYGQYWWDGD